MINFLEWLEWQYEKSGIYDVMVQFNIWKHLVSEPYNRNTYKSLWFDLGGNDTILSDQDILETKEWIENISKNS